MDESGTTARKREKEELMLLKQAKRHCSHKTRNFTFPFLSSWLCDDKACLVEKWGQRVRGSIWFEFDSVDPYELRMLTPGYPDSPA